MRVISRLTRDMLYYTGIIGLHPARRETGTLTVAAYRRVLPREHEQRLACMREDVLDLEHFRASLDVLEEMYTPISLPQLLGYLDAGRPMPPRGALITFDDGWIDTLMTAAPELKRRKLPAVVFVPPSIFGSRGPFWQERLAYAVRIGSISKAQLRSLCDVAGLSPASISGGREAVIGSLVRQLGAFEPEEREDVLNRTVGALPGDGTRHFIAASDMKRFWDHGIVVGCQAFSHEAASADEDMQQDLIQARRTLTEIAGQNIVCMSLPQSRHNGKTVKQAQAAGFKVVFTNDAIVNMLPRPETGKALLGRIRIYPGATKGTIAHTFLNSQIKKLEAA